MERDLDNDKLGRPNFIITLGLIFEKSLVWGVYEHFKYLPPHPWNHSCRKNLLFRRFCWTGVPVNFHA